MLALLYFSTRSSFWVLSSSTSSSNWAMRLSSLRFSSAAKPLKFKSRRPSAILFKSTVRPPSISALRQLLRVPNRFFRIRDLPHLKLGIWSKIGTRLGIECGIGRGMPKITHEITALHETLGRDYGIEETYWGTSLLLSLLLNLCPKGPGTNGPKRRRS